jgi:formylglycine-generating enzyme required for sulfatase activity
MRSPLALTFAALLPLGAVGAAEPPAPGALAATTANPNCVRDLTCARQADVTINRRHDMLVPDLGRWQRLDVAPAPRAQAVSTRPAPGAAAAPDPTTGMAFVQIPGGCYSVPEDAAAAHKGTYCIEPFAMGVTEVTFAEYDRFAEATGRKLPKDEGFGRGDRPVINVSVYDATTFAKWLSRQSGTRYRLPTELEWEHAARAGSTTRFPWGEEIGVGRANCDGCGSRWDGQSTAPVGSFAPNAWGLYDMIGNVGEWTCSMRDPDPARSFEACDGPHESRRRTYRNGGWSDGPERLGAAFRDWNAAVRRTDFVGFRLVREGEVVARPMASQEDEP